MTKIAVLVVTVAALLACFLGALVLFRHTLIYPFVEVPLSKQVGLADGLIEIAAADGTPLSAWAAAPEDGRPVILAFGGNGGYLAGEVARLDPYRRAGYGVVVLNYRGAGGAPGSPQEAKIIADAVALYDAMPDIDGFAAGADGPPILYGASLGAAVAVALATERTARALILEAPFDRLCRVVETRMPIIPACLILPDERWPSAERIAAVDAPVLIVHGDADRIVPFAHGRALYEAAGPPKRFERIAGAGHNDLAGNGAPAVGRAFLEDIAAGAFD
ncbi:MAG: alpha/beta hydrolase [Paracoccaceae bacterium]